MPDETTRRSEGIPERERPRTVAPIDEGPRIDEGPPVEAAKEETRDAEKPRRPGTAVRQDSGVLGDVSPRDETRH